MSLRCYTGNDTSLVSPYVGLFCSLMFADYIAVVAGEISENGVNPSYLNNSGLLSPASSSLDPESSLRAASTLLPQAPADYCGLCIIEAPGGIRLVYWVCTSSEQVVPNHFSNRKTCLGSMKYKILLRGVSLLGILALRRECS